MKVKVFLTALAVTSLLAGAAYGQINIVGLGNNNSGALFGKGWCADDFRADGTGTQAAKTFLISPTLTDDPEGSAYGLTAHDADINSQCVFGAAHAGAPGWQGMVSVHDNSALGAKSQISHRKDDGTGWFSGPSLVNNFNGYYNWYEDTTIDGAGQAATAAFKMGWKTSDFALCGSSTCTGENAWDKVMVYEPYVNGHSPAGTAYQDKWVTESITWNTGNWAIWDRYSGGNTQGNVMTMAQLYSADPIGFQKMCAAGAHLTSVQVGIGSWNSNTHSSVNEMAFNVYQGGQTIQFGTPPVPVTRTVVFDQYEAEWIADVGADDGVPYRGTAATAMSVCTLDPNAINGGMWNFDESGAIIFDGVHGGLGNMMPDVLGIPDGTKYSDITYLEITRYCDATNNANKTIVSSWYTPTGTDPNLGDDSWYQRNWREESIYYDAGRPTGWYTDTTDGSGPDPNDCQMEYFDANHIGTGTPRPTMADMQKGTDYSDQWINWHASGDTTKTNYGNMTVFRLMLKTGSGWAVGNYPVDQMVIKFRNINTGAIDTTTIDFDCAITGDLNSDGVVDVGDLGMLSAGWGTGIYWTQGDINDDDAVDVGDLGMLSAAWGNTGPGGTGLDLDAGVVPLPSALGAGLALLGLAAIRRR